VVARFFLEIADDLEFPGGIVATQSFYPQI